MIGKLTGCFAGTNPEGAALIEVGGVGYAARVPLATLQTLRKNKKSEVSLLIHTAVREDAIDLYGFETAEELSFFKQLMGVKGVGPKTALGILNVADVRTLKHSIARGDAGALTKVYGIGKKSAERIVVELRDKLASEADSPALGGAPEGDSDVIEALIALGYRAAESRQAVRGVGADVAGVHARLSAALKNMAGGT